MENFTNIISLIFFAIILTYIAATYSAYAGHEWQNGNKLRSLTYSSTAIFVFIVAYPWTLRSFELLLKVMLNIMGLAMEGYVIRTTGFIIGTATFALFFLFMMKQTRKQIRNNDVISS